MNAILNTVRNFVAISLAIFVGLYLTVLLQINGFIPSTELSDGVINEVVSKLGE